MYSITKKRQVSIPKKIMQILDLKEHSSIEYIIEKDNTVKIINPYTQIQEAKGILKLPKKYQGKDLSEIIELSKQEYFNKKSND